MNDKLTPGQLRDLADILSLWCENGRLDIAVRDEAARREGEQKLEPFTPNKGCKTYDRCRRDAFCADALHCASLSEGLGSAATFTLEVGREYARRDGTGPVKIVADDKDVWPMYGDDGQLYTRDGFFRTHHNIDPRDLVALWQAEAQAPQTGADDLLVKRVRWLAAQYPDCGLAADRIEAWRDRAAGLDAKNMALAAENDALKARVARLEEAFRNVKSAIRNSEPMRAGLYIDAALAGDAQ
jgi:hypothetical protein